ncbi:MAG: HNH endonuclease [Sphingopyxis sp.]|uniref:HNH endonuclease n=1 Tax=Sphingopyxis sp. TaxID=1908224 RepID=UPI001A4C094F|nr:HNH endonuclease signature motif containing protein [Sphingopyxis sp.]MBL9066462.1 HNH endonuclease [Sphingopyxis sp.]
MTRKSWDHGGKTRQQRGYGREHERIRAELMRTVVTCEECKRHKRTRAGEIADHIIPLAKGGTGDRGNYQLLCRPCAKAKDERDRLAGRRKGTLSPVYSRRKMTTEDWLAGD